MRKALPPRRVEKNAPESARMRHRKNGQHLSHQRENLNMTAIETAPQKSKKRVRGRAMQRFAKACSRVMRDNSDELAAALFRRAAEGSTPVTGEFNGINAIPVACFLRIAPNAPRQPGAESREGERVRDRRVRSDRALPR